MASAVGVDKSQVEQYESGTVEIPVGYLLKVSQCCGVDLTTLISGGEPHLKHFALVKQGRASPERRKDYDYKSLAYSFAGRKMEPFLITVPAKVAEEMNFTSHSGQEFIYLLEGRLEVRVGGSDVVLESGDSLYFDSNAPHGMRGLDGRPAVFLDVIL